MFIYPRPRRTLSSCVACGAAAVRRTRRTPGKDVPIVFVFLDLTRRVEVVNGAPNGRIGALNLLFEVSFRASFMAHTSNQE